MERHNNSLRTITHLPTKEKVTFIQQDLPLVYRN